MTEVITCQLHQNGVLKKAIFEFMRDLLKAEGDNLKKITLFGSVARNEEGADSDIDLFVLLKDDTNPKNMSRARERISDAAFNINLKKTGSGIYISPIVCTENWYEENKKKELLFYDIANDGIVLYDADDR